MTKSIEIPKKHLIVICGPTGSGKTDLSLEVARHLSTEIISADSRQVFKGMPIGTAQPDAAQLARVRHHLIATRDISEPYNAGIYERDALAILGDIFKTRDTAVAVGGSGLYINALCEGMDSLPDGDPGLRAELTAKLASEGISLLLEQLIELDPHYYDKVDRGNPNRVIRALEVCLQTGVPYSQLRKGVKAQRDFGVIKIGTLMPRQLLYERINRRVDMMVDSGLEQEARALYPLRHLNSLQTVGYRELFEYFDGKTTREEAIGLIKRNTRRYAKRQMTWFCRDEGIKWIDPADTGSVIRHIHEMTGML